MTEKMMTAAAEKSSKGRAPADSIQSSKAILQKQAVINDTTEKILMPLVFGDERGCLIETVHVRAGRVIGTRPHFLPHFDPNDPAEDHREWLIDFMNQYYVDNFIPDEVLLPLDVGQDLSKLMEEVLKERSDHKVVVRYATDERGRNLVEMANENAKAHFLKYVSKSEEKLRGLDEIMEKLSLPERPRRIECYDISTFQGTETVASQVVFEDGVPAKEHYRRYRIRTVVGD